MLPTQFFSLPSIYQNVHPVPDKDLHILFQKLQNQITSYLVRICLLFQDYPASDQYILFLQEKTSPIRQIVLLCNHKSTPSVSFSYLFLFPYDVSDHSIFQIYFGDFFHLYQIFQYCQIQYYFF